MDLTAITSFSRRMKKLGINIKMSLNLPWVYIRQVNGKSVKERFLAEHGFTVSILPYTKDGKAQIADVGELMKVIRKYR